jgi:hypothetical protein
MRIELARGCKAQVLDEVATSLAESWRPGDAVAIGLYRSGDGTYGLAVRYAADTPLTRSVIERAHAVAGAECDVREVGVVQPLAWEPAELQQRVRPLRPGLSVAHTSVTAGTIGAFVVPSVQADGEGNAGSGSVPGDDEAVHVLSNNHVLADSDRAQPGEVIVQPGPADGGQAPGDQIGTLARVVAMRRDAANMVDTATAVLDDGIDVDPEHPSGLLTGWRDVDVGVAVEKVGRTTGLTKGQTTAIELDGLTVQYPVGVIAFNGQIEVAGDGTGPFSAGGDSGSVVYDPAAHEAVGLLFAGSERGGPDGLGLTYCNPFGAVLDQLGVQLVSEVTQDDARVAKDALAAQVADDPRVSGVGLTRWRGRYAVQVNVAESSDAPVLPKRIYGVTVRIVAVGRITPRPS